MLEEQLLNTLALLKGNPIIAVLVGVVVLILFYSKPKEMFKMVAFCLFLAFVFYCITLLAGAVRSGSDQKDRMIYKSEEAIGK